MIPFDEACERLRSCLRVAPDALERAESILELQHASLLAEPPARSLPETVTVAALARMRAMEPVIPRQRWPIESPRVVRLLRVLGGSILPGSGVEQAAQPFVEAALPAAQSDDGRGVLRAAERLGLPHEAASALLREALKPEMLRLSMSFAGLSAGARTARCPACRERPCAATSDGTACCRWCGATWGLDLGACAACGKRDLRSRDLGRFAKGASVLQCAPCGATLSLFAVPADPLLLSMLAVLTSPLDLALRMEAEAAPGCGFSVF